MHLVSAYYTIPSKQPESFYIENIKRFFQFVKVPVLFFTDQATLLKLPPAGENIQFRILEFKDLEVFQEFPQEFWERQITRDPEIYHTWQLGAIWANKKYFVKEAAKTVKDDWLLWMDAGCIRTDRWAPFVERLGTRNYTQVPGAYIQTLQPVPAKNYFKYPDIYIAGGLILFHRAYINIYIEQYNHNLKEYDINKIPGTMDQYIMASMTQNSHFVHPVITKPACPDEWFFFLALL
jgi:hypothetical protein